MLLTVGVKYLLDLCNKVRLFVLAYSQYLIGMIAPLVYF
jgi:hypothetical protein